MIIEANIRVTMVTRPRGSVANGNGANRSTVPDFSNAQGFCLDFDMSVSATKRVNQPGFSSAFTSGHTHPSGRANAAASFSRFSITSEATAPAGNCTSARQPVPFSRVIGEGNHPRPVSPLAMARSTRTIWRRLRAVTT